MAEHEPRGKRMENRKAITLKDFLTNAQIQQAWEIYEEETPKFRATFAKRCEREIIEPNIGVIEMKLGQQCDSRYLAYCVEHIFNLVDRGPGGVIDG